VNKLDFSSGKLDKLAKYGAGLGIGYMAWTNQATAKFSSYQTASAPNLFSLQRFCDSTIGLIGNANANALANAINPDQAARGFGNLGGTQKINPLGFLNKTTIYGAVAIIANGLLKDNLPAYKRFPILPEVVEGAGWGALIGGAIGGIFDPAPSGYTATSPSPVTGQMETGGVATGNVPYGRAGSTNKIYGQGSVLA
jgi:hypothetical protein